jgi:2-(1,2-epoxy-1,2-dihydrophenyl)acetyl-CoA isomerase
MSDEIIRLTIDGGVARVTLDRPERGNAMDMPFFRAFGSVVDEVGRRAGEVRAVLITSTGPYFSVGGDIDAFLEAGDRLPELILEGTDHIHPALARLRSMDAPVVVAVQGTAAGGAGSLVAGCDLVIASSSAKIGAAYSRIGFSCDMGASRAYASRMGVARARRFLLLAETLDAESAERVGLVDEVVDPERVTEVAEGYARRFAAGPTRAYGEIRRLVDNALGTPLETQLENEALALARTAGSHDGREGVTAFAEKRKPVFEGR